MDLFLNEAHDILYTYTCTWNMWILPYTHTHIHVRMHGLMYVCMLLSVSVGIYIYYGMSVEVRENILCCFLFTNSYNKWFIVEDWMAMISQGSSQRKWSLMTEYKIHSQDERIFEESLNDFEISFSCDHFTVRSSRKCVRTSECLWDSCRLACEGRAMR